MQIEELNSPEQLRNAFTVLKELRTALSFEDFSNLHDSAKKADEYTLLGALEKDQLVAVMGFRILHDFVHGKHLYVDDLVVTTSHRSKGIGAIFLKHAENIAREKRCKGLRLCTGHENTGGRRFYEREGWIGRAIAYKKPVT